MGWPLFNHVERQLTWLFSLLSWSRHHVCSGPCLYGLDLSAVSLFLLSAVALCACFSVPCRMLLKLVSCSWITEFELQLPDVPCIWNFCWFNSSNRMQVLDCELAVSKDDIFGAVGGKQNHKLPFS